MQRTKENDHDGDDGGHDGGGDGDDGGGGDDDGGGGDDDGGGGDDGDVRASLCRSAALKLTLYIRLDLNSHRQTCLCPLSPGIKRVCHHCQVEMGF